ncbi:exosortase/archaeosortase family protein [Akkermansia sp.]|uniref:exosortase/archaeosortase family protein n=1 Tax=Akkermansia sp. TaxID=1872421 RepID=UPI0025C4DF2C|nr:exosortase/archaeosortase family protein [Akkermansia sp.]MCC8147527.1 exosortase/archaeosortase family protein [Akkermansia sp.]
MGSPLPDAKERFLTVPVIVTLAVSAILLAWPYLAFLEFGSFGNDNSIQWLISSWNKQTDYEHGWLVVPIVAFMLYHARKKIAQAQKRTDWRGLILFIPACLLLALSFRVGQPRVTVAALPLILLGGSWYMAGPQVARLCAFPLLFFWLCIPLPSFQQATVGLQIIATNLGYLGATLFGVDTYLQGTNIRSTGGHWDAFNIAGGCSGMRSLMALLMLSAAWAYLSDLKFWKKCVLFLSAIPLAVIGNGVRITSIVVLAEYGDAQFAAKTWHDWSGLLFFFPICLVGLAVTHSLLAGEMIWKPSRRKKLVVKINKSQ